MEYTLKQKKEIVKNNKQQAKVMIFEAESANKGRHVHFINSCVGTLKCLLKKKLEYGTKDYQRFIDAKVCLGYLLYLVMREKRGWE